MSKFWDQRLHAQLIHDAAARNGHTVKVRLGFVLELIASDGTRHYVTFNELSGNIHAIHRHETGYSPTPVCQPPWGERDLATPRDRVDNLVRYLDEGCPTDFTWHTRNRAMEAFERVTTLYAVDGPLAPLDPTLAPVIDIHMKRQHEAP